MVNQKHKTIMIIGDVASSSAQDIRYQQFIKYLSKLTSIECLSYSISFQTLCDNITSNTVVKHDSFNSAKLVIFIRRCILGVVQRLLIPDKYLVLLSCYKKAIRQTLDENKYNVCFIGMSPYSLLLLGKYIRKLDKGIRLIADMSDPLSFNMKYNDKPVHNMITSMIENKYLKYFDSIIVLNEKIRDKYIKLYPDLLNKVKVIEQGVDAEYIEYVNTFQYNLKIDSIFTFLYAGAFYKKGRNPYNLYRAFEQSRDRVLLKTYSSAKRGLRPKKSVKIEYYKRVPKDELKTVTAKADALIIFDNDNALQVPGKTIETLSINKPILLIYNNEKSPTLDYAKGYASIEYARNDVNEIIKSIHKIAMINSVCRNYDYHKFKWDVLMHKYARIMNINAEE